MNTKEAIILSTQNTHNFKQKCLLYIKQLLADKITHLYQIKNRYNVHYIEPYTTYRPEIIEIFNGKNHDLYEYKNDKYMLHVIGQYYEFVIKDYDKMLEYYMKAINLNNSFAMNSLGVYYSTNKNYAESNKYFNMAINLNNPYAMNNLGLYYEIIEENKKESIKYYLFAIINGDPNGLTNIKINIKSNIVLYNLLNNIVNKNDIIHDELDELKKEKDVILFLQEYNEQNERNIYCEYLMQTEKNNNNNDNTNIYTNTNTYANENTYTNTYTTFNF